MATGKVIAIFLASALVLGQTAVGNDWLLAPSYYSHDPQSGERTSQFAEAEPAFIYEDPSYLKSGYRQRRSTIRSRDGSFDHFHIVEEWGRPVRPYGEWQRPYRPYSVPYDQWGPPFRGLGPNFYNFANPTPFPPGVPGGRPRP